MPTSPTRATLTKKHRQFPASGSRMLKLGSPMNSSALSRRQQRRLMQPRKPAAGRAGRADRATFVAPPATAGAAAAGAAPPLQGTPPPPPAQPLPSSDAWERRMHRIAPGREPEPEPEPEPEEALGVQPSRSKATTSSANATTAAAGGEEGVWVDGHWAPGPAAPTAASEQDPRAAAAALSAAVLRSLAANLKTWLAATSTGSVKFSGAGLKPFFEQHPQLQAAVQANPGLLGAVVARARSLEARWAAGGAEIQLTPPSRRRVFITATVGASASASAPEKQPRSSKPMSYRQAAMFRSLAVSC